MKSLAILSVTEKADRAKIQSLEVPEADRVWELYEAGILTEIFLFADMSGAVILLDTETEGEAADAIESLPMVREKILAPDIRPMTVWPEMRRMLTEKGRPEPEWWPRTIQGDKP
ncbi:MAG: hypothetical protein AAFZ38_07810 [Myxococcota bacterium]